MRYVHTSLVARDWRALAAFYTEVFGCRPVPPERRFEGDWLSRGTGVPDAALEGCHLRLPGHGNAGPTLEIFTYRSIHERDVPAPNAHGLAHLAFEVDDVAEKLAELLARGGSTLGEVTAREVEGVGHLTYVYARDPEGNVLELQAWS